MARRKESQDPDYVPDVWLPVIDAKKLTDKTLNDTKERLKGQGVKVQVKYNRKYRLYTLYRYGGWTTKFG